MAKTKTKLGGAYDVDDGRFDASNDDLRASIVEAFAPILPAASIQRLKPGPGERTYDDTGYAMGDGFVQITNALNGCCASFSFWETAPAYSDAETFLSETSGAVGLRVSIRPLGAPATALLKIIPREDGDEYVFPAERGEGFYQGTKRVWILGHTNMRSTQIYAHLQADPAARATERVVGSLSAALDRRPSAKITPIRRARP